MILPESPEEYVRLILESTKTTKIYDVVRYLCRIYDHTKWDNTVSSWVVRNWAWLYDMGELEVVQIRDNAVSVQFVQSGFRWAIRKSEFPDFYEMIRGSLVWTELIHCRDRPNS